MAVSGWNSVLITVYIIRNGSVYMQKYMRNGAASLQFTPPAGPANYIVRFATNEWNNCQFLPITAMFNVFRK